MKWWSHVCIYARIVSAHTHTYTHIWARHGEHVCRKVMRFTRWNWKTFDYAQIAHTIKYSPLRVHCIGAIIRHPSAFRTYQLHIRHREMENGQTASARIAERRCAAVIDEKQVDDDAEEVQAYVYILLSCMSRKCHQISYYSRTSACTNTNSWSEACAMVNKCLNTRHIYISHARVHFATHISSIHIFWRIHTHSTSAQYTHK